MLVRPRDRRRHGGASVGRRLAATIITLRRRRARDHCAIRVLSNVPSRSHSFLVWFCLWALVPSPTSGQTLGGPRPAALVASEFGLLTGLRTGLDIRSLGGAAADQAFDWDVDMVIDLDLVDLGFVRSNLFIGYEQMVGGQKRNIDPNQNSYAIDGSLFFPLPRGEVGAFFHHISRHRVDRATEESISWNMVGGSYTDRAIAARVELEAGIRGMFTVERAGVDYRGQVEAHVSAIRPLNDRVAVVGRAEGVVVPVDRLMFGRTTQRGGRLEGGLRVYGNTASVDAFVGWEQRIDASFGKIDTLRWVTTGLRVVAAVP